ncbi:hypothetical protein LB941_08970 [Ligilactobacillus sp. WILCCON 0076]|uniref:CBS domain-containing protein n=1 Tax=Ligilactobacillus ubinensis TaxID=2876789 RepID=A0A9X2FKP4_9LACO|nr:CBS domain-containing protein [Ligilactobacillus ubinensis]MCP0887467.1 hypothetical protein [Ligilactobacillus ubinensis]
MQKIILLVRIDQEKRNREARRLMVRHGISNLIVTDSQKEVVGVVMIHEVL